jgi:D-alanyl-D-alanine-carboxypeptidase/D-alanyl-D-alanine-endopeptidase
MMNRRTFILSSCASLLALHRAGAQTVNLSNEAIRDILRRRIDVEKRATGMAVGIVERGRRRVILHGKQDSGDARTVAGNTLFEIGSLTKVFTALLMADMVHRKELQFDDPVDRYLPSGFRTPQRNGRAITLADLATHTSGLPLFPPITGNPLEALARYTASDLRSWLAGLTLSRDPGAQWEYSNVGYGLLGLALANKAGTTYDALLNRRIIGPLRLKDTALHPTGEATRRLAAGHDPKLAPIPPLDLGIFAPAGALRSTVENLLSFLSAVLPDSGSPLEAPAQLLLSIRRPVPAIGGDQALGWDVVAGTDPFVAKDGVTAGQAASIVLDAPKRIGVVVLSNTLPVKMKAPPDGGVGAADLARHLIRPALPVG